MSSTFKSEFIDSWKKTARAEGLAEGLAEGHAEGLAEAKASDILKIMDARNLKLSQEQRARVTASTDLGQLDLWFDRALTADSADEVFRP